MVAALVAAPAVAKAATASSAWGDAAILSSARCSSLIGEADIGVLQAYGPTKAALEEILSYVRVADCRWVSLMHAKDNGRYTKSHVAVDDGSRHPIRFNESQVFIEPMLTICTDNGPAKWVENPVWAHARYQIAVSPDTKYPMEYTKEIQKWPEMRLWFGRFTRKNNLHPLARPSAVYFDRA